MAHEIMEEPEMALMIYQRIIEKNPVFLKAYIQKAALLMQMEKFAEACEIFRAILKINPDYYRAYLGIGICFDKIGEETKAKRYYRKYLKLKPEASNSISVKHRMDSIELPVHENFLKVCR